MTIVEPPQATDPELGPGDAAARARAQAHFIEQLTWSPDSSSLAVTLDVAVNGNQSLATWLIGATDAPGSLEAMPRVPLPACPGTPWFSPSFTSSPATWVGFLGPSQGLVLCSNGGFDQRTSRTTFRVIDPSTGALTGRLPELRGHLAKGGNFAGSSGSVEIAPGGHQLALIGEEHGAARLEVWSVGSQPWRTHDRPVPVLRGVTSVAWVPGSSWPR